jgi:hypothetical protein
MKQQRVFKSYAEQFSCRLSELTSALSNKPQYTHFYTKDQERKRIKSLGVLYNLNLKLLKIFDEKETRPYLEL